MAQDPAFLFYTNDFLSGTQFFTDEQLGKYLRLLMAQHQHGHLSEKQVIFICKSKDEEVMSKFIKDENGLYFNERLQIEIEKRKSFAISRSNNKKGKFKVKDTENISKSYDIHMEDRNINRDINEFNTNKGVKSIFRFLDMGEISVKPSEWLKTYAKLTIENNLIKNKFTPDQMEDIYFKFDLNESDKQFTDANHLKNTFKKFCELRRKELDGVLVSKGGSSKQSASYLQNL